MTNEELWQAVLSQVQFSVSRANFATWFRSTKIAANQKGEITVTVPNSFSQEWLGNKYQSLILKILRSLDGNVRQVCFAVTIPNPDSTKESAMPQKAILSPIAALETQLQFQELNINQKTNLNPRYSFDNFIVGSFNELAHAAAWAVSDNPGKAYNPLFIYGGVGLGKTHLLQATGNRITSLNPKRKVLYTSSERLVSKIIESIKSQTIDALKNELGNLDVLIMDDVQFLAGKEKTQEEFFHIFNALYQKQKQIILSSDRPPNAIPALEERLKSRFEGGMMADISTPTIETRIAILKAKCEEKDITLPEDVLGYIASHVQRNIRELEGALNPLIIFKKVNQKIPDVVDVKRLLKNLIAAPRKATSPNKIIHAVTAFYDLNKGDLLLKTRRKEIVKPRQIAMYLLRKELQESFPSIGRKFQGKDHTTAIYAYEKINKLVEEDETMLTEVNLIKQRLYAEI